MPPPLDDVYAQIFEARSRGWIMWPAEYDLEAGRLLEKFQVLWREYYRGPKPTAQELVQTLRQLYLEAKARSQN